MGVLVWLKLNKTALYVWDRCFKECLVPLKMFRYCDDYSSGNNIRLPGVASNVRCWWCVCASPWSRRLTPDTLRCTRIWLYRRLPSSAPSACSNCARVSPNSWCPGMRSARTVAGLKPFASSHSATSSGLDFCKWEINFDYTKLISTVLRGIVACVPTLLIVRNFRMLL